MPAIIAADVVPAAAAARASADRPQMTQTTRTVAIHQVLATLGYGDAIGHEVLGIQRVLRGAGYESDIFVQTADPRLEHLTEDYRDLEHASHPDNILIHHFSIGSRASRMAYALPDRMVLIYHNITPPEFFVDVNKELVQLCFRGRRELSLYKSRCDLALGDSEYNRQELETIGFSPTGVLDVVPGFDHLAGQPDYTFAKAFDDDWVNLLFVGRVIPNKKIEDVIRFFHAYKTAFNPRSRLLLVGAHSGFERYLTMLHNFIAAIGARDVHLIGHVTNEELTAYYQLADAFVCASEHEGFCVPLIESFHMGVPVIAYAATAVPSTMDGAGVLYGDKDPLHVAALINAVVDDHDVAARIVEGQDEALDRLARKDFGATLLHHIDAVLAAPRRTHPPVAFDFWDQVDRAEEYDEIKQYRPAAFQALPEEP
jgi:glycosyltransferase involved in cell wall biosynthesis